MLAGAELAAEPIAADLRAVRGELAARRFRAGL
jgi:hypothetical protein